MNLSKQEFMQEIKKAIEFTFEIEKGAQDMDPDDIADFCEKIRMPLQRMLEDLGKEKAKGKKY